MTLQYSSKVNIDGTWRKFPGWTVISSVLTDLKFLENLIIFNNVLNKYFSPLPSSSYHVTLYNIWSVNSPLLTPQKEYISTLPLETQEAMLEYSRSNELFNLNGCMNNMLYDFHNTCETQWKSVKLTINKVIYDGNTISITFIKNEPRECITKCRKKLIDTANKTDHMKCLHMTLAYKCKKTCDNDKLEIHNELQTLNLILKNQTLEIRNPQVCSFEDMTEFIPIFPS
jgi:hypothetical protein